jgi:hypothetical protein
MKDNNKDNKDNKKNQQHSIIYVYNDILDLKNKIKLIVFVFRLFLFTLKPYLFSDFPPLFIVVPTFDCYLLSNLTKHLKKFKCFPLIFLELIVKCLSLFNVL